MSGRFAARFIRRLVAQVIARGFAVCAIALIFALAGCSKFSGQAVTFHETGSPSLLGDWGVLSSDGKQLRIAERVMPYTLNATLFSDYAHKLRTIWVPEGSPLKTDGSDFDYPVGTIISKTFFYPTDQDGLLKADDNGALFDPAIGTDGGLDLRKVKLLETRLLVKRADAWVAFPYVWNDAQTEAHLEVTGSIKKIAIHDREGIK